MLQEFHNLCTLFVIDDHKCGKIGAESMFVYAICFNFNECNEVAEQNHDIIAWVTYVLS